MLLVVFNVYAQIQFKTVLIPSNYSLKINSEGNGVGENFYYDFSTNTYTPLEPGINTVVDISETNLLVGLNSDGYPAYGYEGIWTSPTEFLNFPGGYYIRDISDDGNFITGMVDAVDFIYNIESNELRFYPPINDKKFHIFSVNNNGIGVGQVLTNNAQGDNILNAAYFNEENVVLISNNNSFNNSANSINNNNEVVGYLNNLPFIYKINSSELITFTLPEDYVMVSFVDISDNGIATGYAGGEGILGLKNFPIIYHPSLGSQPYILTSYLMDFGVDTQELTDAMYSAPNSISSDGNFISGWYTDDYDGEYTNWIVFLDDILKIKDNNLNSVQIYTQQNLIYVNSKSDKILMVELFDLNGRKVYEKNNINELSYKINPSSKGILILKVQTQNGQITNKKVILK